MGVEKSRSDQTLRLVPKHLTSEKDVFCNRELNMKQIEAIGFDMDYTLAQYYSSFDLLAFEGAKNKLVNMLGYPKEILTFPYNSCNFTRGLVIDIKRGNIIKMDRHKYVRVAFHGNKELSSKERKKIYHASFMHTSLNNDKNFVNMDTLFSVVDSVLFAHLIDFKDSNPEKIPQPYDLLFNEMRYCVNMCHNDGVIKDRVAEEPEKFIMPDHEILPMLRRLKSEGKKTFLLTNSLWDYTSVVMNFLYKEGGGRIKGESSWLDLFDVIIVGSCKPNFILQSNSALFRVNTATNTLTNVIDEEVSMDHFLNESKVFQGGNWTHLHKIMKLSSGDRLLYVGDHMYSDILRSKRSLGWRTCLIVPELENEIKTHKDHKGMRKYVNELRARQYDLDEYTDQLRLQILREENGAKAEHLNKELDTRMVELNFIKRTLSEEGKKFHKMFHTYWGQLFKSGYQDSLFSQQVSSYACLYTSKASNLVSMSCSRSFRPAPDLSVFDQLLDNSERVVEDLRLLRDRIEQQKTV